MESIQHVLVAIDVSYSMSGFIENAVKGLNEFVVRLRVMHPSCYLSVVWFNDDWGYVIKGMPVSTQVFTMSNFTCRGTTSLFDCVYDLVNEWGVYDNPTFMYVISDGDDNSSKRYKEVDVADICSRAIKTKGWMITHCSTETSKLIPHTKQVRYDVDDIENMMSGLGL
jgi:hypothetical protein